MDEIPYEIERHNGYAFVRFAKICDHERTDDRRRDLIELVSTCNQIVCDLTHTKTIVFGWIRLLEALTVEAEKMKKIFVIAGMSKTVKESADEMGVGSYLKHIVIRQETKEDNNCSCHI